MTCFFPRVIFLENIWERNPPTRNRLRPSAATNFIFIPGSSCTEIPKWEHSYYYNLSQKMWNAILCPGSMNIDLHQNCKHFWMPFQIQAVSFEIFRFSSHLKWGHVAWTSVPRLRKLIRETFSYPNRQGKIEHVIHGQNCWLFYLYVLKCIWYINKIIAFTFSCDKWKEIDTLQGK